MNTVLSIPHLRCGSCSVRSWSRCSVSCAGSCGTGSTPSRASFGDAMANLVPIDPARTVPPDRIEILSNPGACLRVARPARGDSGRSALGNVDRVRTVAAGPSLITRIAAEQRQQTAPTLYGGRAGPSSASFPFRGQRHRQPRDLGSRARTAGGRCRRQLWRAGRVAVGARRLGSLGRRVERRGGQGEQSGRRATSALFFPAALSCA